MESDDDMKSTVECNEGHKLVVNDGHKLEVNEQVMYEGHKLVVNEGHKLVVNEQVLKVRREVLCLRVKLGVSFQLGVSVSVTYIYCPN